MGAGDSGFRLIEEDGWDEIELYEADSLEEMSEFLQLKSGDGNG